LVLKCSPQSAALVLTSTPAEALAVAVRSLLAPLRLLRVPVPEIGGWRQLQAYLF
jgi:energy-coupling factor transporter transmembrane protein EcfT